MGATAPPIPKPAPEIVYPIRPDTTALPDTPARAFVRGAQAGAVIAHYRRWLIEQDLSDTIETRRAFGFPEEVTAQPLRPLVAESLPPSRVVRTGRSISLGQALEQTGRSIASGAAPPRSRPGGSLASAPRPPEAFQAQAIAQAGNALITQLTNQYYEEKRLRGERLHRMATSGPKRALATRPLSTSGAGAALTNRRGALSQPLGTLSPAAVVARTAGANTGKSVSGPSTSTKAAAKGLSGRGSGGLISERKAASSSQTRSTTGHAPNYRDLSKMAQGLQSQVLDQFLSGRATRMGLVRGHATDLVERVVGEGPAVLPLPGLTSANATGVGSATKTGTQLASCQCKKPTPPRGEDKKQRKVRCVNPVISNSVKDGIQTITRRVTCQPSKPKSP